MTDGEDPLMLERQLKAALVSLETEVADLGRALDVMKAQRDRLVGKTVKDDDKDGTALALGMSACLVALTKVVKSQSIYLYRLSGSHFGVVHEMLELEDGGDSEDSEDSMDGSEDESELDCDGVACSQSRPRVRFVTGKRTRE